MATKFPIPATLICTFSLLVIILPFTACTTNFSFTSFTLNDPNISFSGASSAIDGALRLTDSQYLGNVFNSTGRVQYTQPIQLWDPTTNSTTNFTTTFDFIIQFPNNDQDSNSSSSGGFAFFLAPEGSDIPANSGGGWLGLFNQTTDGNPSNRVVAVEFDTFQDAWDPSNNHVGIDVNSIVSKANKTWSNTMKSGDTYEARISYDAASKNLMVHLKDPQIPVDTGSLNLTYEVDLRLYLPEKVIMGFSASTGSSVVVQRITAWNLTSSMDPVGTIKGGEEKGSSNKMWVVGLIICLVVLVVGAVPTVWFFRRRSSNRRKMRDEQGMDFDESMEDEFARGTGPRRFSYKELASATNNFAEIGKLGEGGFGGVYKGFLRDLNIHVAVKKISERSKQGKKEYAAEVNIISRLRHRNLVQLVGWNHGYDGLLLVYEFMPNGSLDSHLFSNRTTLTWGVRYKIAMGLASALLYLQEEWEQCVVHRDIKTSNIMLGSGFVTKLGDFGLSRLVDHKLGSQTTALAGTLGYIAPECFITGKASKESDVFSFGIVALEIACGRKAVETNREEHEVRLVEWAWELYGRGRILEAVDERLQMDFDVKQMESLMLVGLWCAHPDRHQRPSMRQVLQVLNFEATVPDLPNKMPVPIYAAPLASPVNSNPMSSLSYTNSLLSGR